MASYELVFKTSVAKDLRSLPRQDVKRILLRIGALASDPDGRRIRGAVLLRDWPPGCEKLSGLERYRVRQGAYRIIYEIEDARLVVLVVKIGHRREVYRAN